MTATTARYPTRIWPSLPLLALAAIGVVTLSTTHTETTPYRLWTTPPEDGRPTSLHRDLAHCEKARRFFMSNNPGRKAWCKAE